MADWRIGRLADWLLAVGCWLLAVGYWGRALLVGGRGSCRLFPDARRATGGAISRACSANMCPACVAGIHFVWIISFLTAVTVGTAWSGEAVKPAQAKDGAAVAPTTGPAIDPLSLVSQNNRLEIKAEDEAFLLRTLQEKGPRDKAVEKAIEFLAGRQRTDGSFSKRFPVASTGLAVMAFMAAGHAPDDEKYGETIRRGIHYVLSQMDANGYLGGRDKSHMYGHGICTLMLMEALGMMRERVLERRLIEQGRKAVALILQAQAVKKHENAKGGWRYYPTSKDSDLSLTGWQTMALRAAKNAGMEVPGAAIDSAVGFITRMAHPKGGFGYSKPDDRTALRGVGILALSVCGKYDAPEVGLAVARMLQDPPQWKGPFFYYRIYYSTVGMYQAGGESWERFHPTVDALLLKHQNADGSWPSPPGNNESGSVYMSSMAVLALAVHYHLLPIYQR